PCTPAFFYGASATGASIATVDGTAAVATAETWGIPATTGLSWLYTLNPARAAVAVGKGLEKGWKPVHSACNWLGTVNWELLHFQGMAKPQARGSGVGM